MIENDRQNDLVIETTEDRQTGKRRSFLRTLIGVLFIFVFILIASISTLNYLQTPTKDFPVNKPLTIELGTSMRSAIRQIKEAGMIHSEIALYAQMLLHHKNQPIKASTYLFTRPLTLSELAEELTRGNHRSNLVKLTHIEGETIKSLANRAMGTLIDFDINKFLQLAENHEGSLFPDTYLVPSNYTAEELFTLLSNTFQEKISPYQEDIMNHKLTLNEIVILASILEREANTKESLKMVSGILQNRLEISMPLQVDASIEYILDKPLSELTPEDLKIDSPYNTYLNKGLPPTAIGNPGLEAIEAVLHPEPTDFLFYVTDADGNFYYAKNFDEHRKNVARYLR